MPDDSEAIDQDTRTAEGDGAEAAAASSGAKVPMPPVAVLGFVIVALLVVLLVISNRGRMGGGYTNEDLVELQAEVNARRSELNRERMAYGLRPLEGGSEDIEDIAARLKKDADTMVALAGSFQSLLAEKDTQFSAKSAELLRSEEQRMSLAAEAQRLRSQLQEALVNSSTAEAVQRELANLKAQRDALSAELATLRQQPAGVNAEDFADVQRRLEEALRAKDFFESRAAELEAELSKARLFASSESELLPAAVELVRSLRKLENRPDSDLTTAYSNLGADLGATVRHTLNFATGSSALTPADEERIRTLVEEIPDGDLVLAIGYASETGNVDQNRTLSSDRATAVAELFSGIKRPEQLVQAVYLGQTDRFSSRIPERNQLVEVWHIRRK
jgi:outer membrane protein OmpA-like peptidoglycan-associated protein